eukprot:13752146-Alexandrium_andersonii.AAC.1
MPKNEKGPSPKPPCQTPPPQPESSSSAHSEQGYFAQHLPERLQKDPRDFYFFGWDFHINQAWRVRANLRTSEKEYTSDIQPGTTPEDPVIAAFADGMQ